MKFDSLDYLCRDSQSKNYLLEFSIKISIFRTLYFKQPQLAHLCNNFNQSSAMSSSLPRIKTFSELPKHSSGDQNKELKLKFKKLNVDNQNQEQRKKSIKSIKTQRLKSLERYSTIQEQREYKKQKIQMNLIERKLLSGTYDENKETGNELTVLKNKRDQIKVQMALKQRQIQRKRLMVNDIKKQINELLSQKGQHDGKMDALKEKYDQQLLKTQQAQQNRLILEYLIRTRQEVIFTLSKRNEDGKDQLSQLKTVFKLLQSQLREVNEKLYLNENKNDVLQREAKTQRDKQNQFIFKHQEKIAKRKEGEMLQTEKSRQYLIHLDEIDRQNQIKEFHNFYDKILANIFVQRFCKKTLMDFRQKYQDHEHFFNVITSSKLFESDNPKQFAQRFYKLQPYKNSLTQQIAKKQSLINSLEAQCQVLRKKYDDCWRQEMNTQENIENLRFQIEQRKQNKEIESLKTIIQTNKQKTMRIKLTILKMLRDLKQKGDRKLADNSQSTVSNMNKLTSFIREAFKQIQ